MTIEKQYIKQLNESLQKSEGKKAIVLSDEDYIKHLKSYMHNNPDFQKLWNMLPMINDDLKDDGIKTLTSFKLKKYYNMIQAQKSEATENDFSGEVEEIKDAVGNVLHVGDPVAHILGGEGHSKLRIERGIITEIKNGKAKVKKATLKSTIYPHKLIKTYGENQ